MRWVLSLGAAHKDMSADAIIAAIGWAPTVRHEPGVPFVTRRGKTTDRLGRWTYVLFDLPTTEEELEPYILARAKELKERQPLIAPLRAEGLKLTFRAGLFLDGDSGMELPSATLALLGEIDVGLQLFIYEPEQARLQPEPTE